MSSRVSLASQYAYLQDAAQQGRTYNEISAEHTDSPAESEDQGSFERISVGPGQAENQGIAHSETEEVGDHAEIAEGKTVDEPQHSLEDDFRIEAASEDIYTAANAGISGSPDLQNTHPDTIDPEIDSLATITEPEIEPEPVKTRDFGVASQDPDEDGDQVGNEPHQLREETPTGDEILPSTDLQAANEDAHDKTSGIESMSGDAELSQDAHTALNESNKSLSEFQDATADDAELKDELQNPATEADELLDFDTNEIDIGSLDNPSGDVVESLEDHEDLNTEAMLSNGASTNGHAPTGQDVTSVTPSKLRRSKRKLAQNDDELELLDFDTPENKRRRPS